MSTTQALTGAVDHERVSPPGPRRWLVLATIAVSQLMIVLDSSIVNIALPHAQRALHISDADRQWVITAYTLGFGGLLLLGGRVADYAGRKRVFVIGLIGFALASALGGLSPSAGILFGARGLQGAFAALMAPAALSLLATTFTEPKERAQAFSVYGGISGGGAAVGLILGGVLTQYATWRWCLLVNTPIALITALCAVRLLDESRAAGRPSYDLPGALTVTLGLVALVYGFTEAGSYGWGSPTTLVSLAIGAGLLTAFVFNESRAAQPLLPLRVATDRNRGGAFIAALLSAMGLFGMFLFLTYYLQGTLHYSALTTGFAFLPFSGGIIVGAALTSQLLPRVGPRDLLVPGLALAAVGLVWFTQIGLHTSYLTHVVPAELLVSVGMGLTFVTVASTALVGVADSDSGVASAMINANQQIGGSLGTALLNTIAATATAGYLVTHHGAQAAGLIHGYRVAFLISALILAAGALLAGVHIRAGRDDLPAAETTASVPSS
jgi:EmrB/QacA subfamily drug resistance transporter